MVDYRCKRRVPVSVVIPYFNSSNTICRCLRSVREQTVLPIEVIIIDDGSTLQEWKLLQELGRKEDVLDIKLLRLVINRGAGYARNAAWSAVAKECMLVAFLDSDDIWLPRKLERISMIMMHNRQIEMCGHAAYITDSIKNKFACIYDIETREREKKIPLRYLSIFRVLISNPFVTPSIVIRKDSHFRFNSNQRLVEDYDLIIRIALNNKKIAYSEDRLAVVEKVYGRTGTSRILWKMRLAELVMFKELWKRGQISILLFSVVSVYSLIKHTVKFLLRTELALKLMRILKNSQHIV